MLKDGRTINLTARRLGTNYNSSDLTICNFGVEDGWVFAGNNGSCMITITNSGFGTAAHGTIRTVSPADTAKISPMVRITSPASGALITGGIAGVELPITVEATDDVAVTSVYLLVDGEVAFTGTTAPYQFNLEIPPWVTKLTLSAMAIDFGNNIGMSEEVQVAVSGEVAGEVIGPPVSVLNSTDPSGPDIGNVTGEAVGPPVSVLNSTDPSGPDIGSAAGEAVGPPVSVLNSTNPSGPDVGQTDPSVSDAESGEAVGAPVSVLNSTDPSVPTGEKGESVGPVLSIENKVP